MSVDLAKMSTARLREWAADCRSLAATTRRHADDLERRADWIDAHLAQRREHEAGA